jgi:hypothetical protein
MNLITSTLAFMLVSALLMVAAPTDPAPVDPVGLDPECAAELRARITHGDDHVEVLGCDRAGRGRAVVALGEPRSARSVVVLVPGSDIDLHTLDDDPVRRPMAWARSLAAASGPSTAVVLWVGYPTPRGLGYDAAAGRLARAAAPALVAMVAWLRAGGARVTVVAHSYGTVVAALAAPDLAADDLVFLGSPGVRARSVAELGGPARVWAARADRDWIRFVPNVRLGDLGHGGDPAAPSFGARPLPVAGVRAHDGYLQPGSPTLAAIAALAQDPGVPAGAAR